MGGNSSNAAPVQPVTPPTPEPGPGGMTGYGQLAPFMPGFDQAIASQLQQGYGGNMQDMLSYFQNLYSPIQIPKYGKSGGNLPPGIDPLPKGESTGNKSSGNEMRDAETGLPLGEAKGFRIEGNRLVKIPRK